MSPLHLYMERAPCFQNSSGNTRKVLDRFFGRGFLNLLLSRKIIENGKWILIILWNLWKYSKLNAKTTCYKPQKWHIEIVYADFILNSHRHASCQKKGKVNENQSEIIESYVQGVIPCHQLNFFDFQEKSGRYTKRFDGKILKIDFCKKMGAAEAFGSFHAPVPLCIFKYGWRQTKKNPFWIGRNTADESLLSIF